MYCRGANYLLYRRIICARVGRARLVTNASEVNEADGVYLSHPLFDMKEFLNDPLLYYVRNRFRTGYSFVMEYRRAPIYIYIIPLRFVSYRAVSYIVDVRARGIFPQVSKALAPSAPCRRVRKVSG